MGREYVDRLTLTVRGDPSARVTLLAVNGDPNGLVFADPGDHAFENGSSRSWICRGGDDWDPETIGYDPETPSDWGGSPPSQKAAALDRLASAYHALTGNPVP